MIFTFKVAMNVCLILFMNRSLLYIIIIHKNAHTHILYNCFDCLISIRLHDISLLIHLNIVNVSQNYIDLKS